ncbi:MAG: LON peptidase substrate-binding domain-containing protein [Casimicrobium sp.]
MFSFLGKKATSASKTESLALFPLQTTIFPGGRLSLRVFEQRYYELAKNCIATGDSFGIVTLNAGNEVGANQSFAKVGTAVSIASFDAPQPNLFVLDVIGQQRFEIVSSRVRSNGLHHADVRWIPNEEKSPISTEYATLVTALKPVVEALGETRFAPPFELDDASWVGSRLAEIIKMPPALKQTLLEINDAELRLKTLSQLMARGAASTN